MFRFPKVLASNVCSEIRFVIVFHIASGKLYCLKTLSVTEIIQRLGWLDCWVEWWMIHGWIDGWLNMEHWVEWYWHRESEVFCRKRTPVSLCPPQIPYELTGIESGPPWWEGLSADGRISRRCIIHRNRINK